MQGFGVPVGLLTVGLETVYDSRLLLGLFSSCWVALFSLIMRGVPGLSVTS